MSTFRTNIVHELIKVGKTIYKFQLLDAFEEFV